MTCEQCYVYEQTVLQCSRTMLLAMTYDLCHGGHMVAEYPLLHTPTEKNHISSPKHRKSPLSTDFQQKHNKKQWHPKNCLHANVMCFLLNNSQRS